MLLLLGLFTRFLLLKSQEINLINSECFVDSNDAVEFLFFQEESTFDVAEQECAVVNGTLAILTEERKYNQLVEFITIRNITFNQAFIGLVKPDNDILSVNPINFIWEDGTIINEGDFASVRGENPWGLGRPNSNGEQGCIVLQNNLLFNDFFVEFKEYLFANEVVHFLMKMKKKKC